MKQALNVIAHHYGKEYYLRAGIQPLPMFSPRAKHIGSKRVKWNDQLEAYYPVFKDQLDFFCHGPQNANATVPVLFYTNEFPSC